MQWEPLSVSIFSTCIRQTNRPIAIGHCWFLFTGDPLPGPARTFHSDASGANTVTFHDGVYLASQIEGEAPVRVIVRPVPWGHNGGDGGPPQQRHNGEVILLQ